MYPQNKLGCAGCSVASRDDMVLLSQTMPRQPEGFRMSNTYCTQTLCGNKRGIEWQLSVKVYAKPSWLT